MLRISISIRFHMPSAVTGHRERKKQSFFHSILFKQTQFLHTLLTLKKKSINDFAKRHNNYLKCAREAYSRTLFLFVQLRFSAALVRQMMLGKSAGKLMSGWPYWYWVVFSIEGTPSGLSLVFAQF